MKQKHNGGYSLIEILIAIAVLGIVTIPATSSLLTAHRVNVQAEKMLTAQLQVSSAVETLMAEGIEDDCTVASTISMDGVNVQIKEDHTTYYKVMVTSDKESSVYVETYIRALNGGRL